MMQREISDPENVVWKCVQAYAGLSDAAGEAAADRVENAEGKVPVVCTPSGGAQSVRLELERDWPEAMPDADLLAAIRAAQA